jgi:hypothetical protein
LDYFTLVARQKEIEAQQEAGFDYGRDAKYILGY